MNIKIGHIDWTIFECVILINGDNEARCKVCGDELLAFFIKNHKFLSGWTCKGMMPDEDTTDYWVRLVNCHEATQGHQENLLMWKLGAKGS